MKILYHHRTQAEDAQGIHIYEMVKAFRSLGHEVKMAALVTKEGDNKIQGHLWEKVTQHIPPWIYELMSLAYNLVGYRRLAKDIKAFQPDAIYERYALNTFCGIWASKRFGIPIILEVNAPLYLEQKRFGKLAFKKLASFSERWICSNSSVTLVVSNAMKEILQAEGVDAGKMTVMPNGIDPQKFHPEISGEKIRAAYNLQGKIVIGFVGWFRKWHGLEMLLEIMNEAKLAEKNVCLLLVGDGPAFPALHAYVKTHGLEAVVKFTGPAQRAEIPACVAAMDIAVQPAANEYACPMKVFEHMGMAKCIVAPDQPNIREVLNHEQSASLFLPRNKQALQSALLRLVADAEERKRIGEAAYQSLCENKFLWQRNAELSLSLVFDSKHGKSNWQNHVLEPSVGQCNP